METSKIDQFLEFVSSDSASNKPAAILSDTEVGFICSLIDEGDKRSLAFIETILEAGQERFLQSPFRNLL